MGWFGGKKAKNENVGDGQPAFDVSRRNFLRRSAASVAVLSVAPSTAIDALASMAPDPQVQKVAQAMLGLFQARSDLSQLKTDQGYYALLHSREHELKPDELEAFLTKMHASFEKPVEAVIQSTLDVRRAIDKLSFEQVQDLFSRLPKERLAEQYVNANFVNPADMQGQLPAIQQHIRMRMQRVMVHPEQLMTDMVPAKAVGANAHQLTQQYLKEMESGARAAMPEIKSRIRDKADRVAKEVEKNFPNTIRNVRARGDGQFAVQFYAMRASLHDLDNKSERRDAMLSMLRKRFGATLEMEQTQSAPEYVRVTCEQNSAASLFFTKLSERKLSIASRSAA